MSDLLCIFAKIKICWFRCVRHKFAYFCCDFEPVAIQIAREVQNEHCAYYVNGHMILIDLACSCSEWLVSDLLCIFAKVENCWFRYVRHEFA